MGWFQNIKEERPQTLSELSVFLRAVDRLFIIENLSLSDQDYPSRNFYEEFLVLRDVILRIINLIELLMPENEKNSYWFRKYAEQRFMTIPARDTLRNELYRQDSPEKGLLLLYDSFVNIKTLVFDLLKYQTIHYISYKDIGDIISREIRENKYFNPFTKAISEEDRIDNPLISKTLKTIEDRTIKKYISLIMVSFFRILRDLRYVVTDTSDQAVLNRSIAILFLIRSELEELKRLLEITVLKIQRPDISNFLSGLSYQISMETKRVFFQELKDITKKGGQKRQRGRIENSSGIIKNFVTQSVVQTLQLFNPYIMGEDIFPSFVTKKQLSLKLREDIMVMHRIVSLLIDNPKREGLHESLKNYIHYFQSFTFRLLRYDDYEEFSGFIEEIIGYLRRGLKEDILLHKFIERLNHFKIFLETILRQIAQREELRGEPIDEERIRNIMEQFVLREIEKE
ncbi:MAG: hypothetical protein N2257_03720 [Thermodesulfovibrionales bacterium]|nr:hypothetical protein [Thermodesulfovibrionales bacterium]